MVVTRPAKRSFRQSAQGGSAETSAAATLTRRDLFAAGTAAAALSLSCSRVPLDTDPEPSLDSEFASLEQALADLFAAKGSLERPGFSAALVLDGKPVWSGAYGLADLESGRPRTAGDLQNIGSVTKTLTTTLALQQVERQTLTLDDDVQRWLDFPVRNPRHPDLPITLRQLLVHRSSILDAQPYEDSYVCGDQTGELGAWLHQYFTYSRLAEHFHNWAPGTLQPPEQPRAYSNVAFGLVGHLVERVTGRSFAQELDASVLQPLGMNSSGILLSDIDTSRHVVPYSLPGPEEVDLPREELLVRSETQPIVSGEHFGHCLYSFATPPDGLLRTSASELARFIAAWANAGELDGQRILQASSVSTALRDEHLGRGLCWSTSSTWDGGPFFLHGGGDPGIATVAAFRPEGRCGLVLLCNSSAPDPGPRQLIDPLLAEINRRSPIA